MGHGSSAALRKAHPREVGSRRVYLFMRSGHNGATWVSGEEERAAHSLARGHTHGRVHGAWHAICGVVLYFSAFPFCFCCPISFVFKEKGDGK